MLQIVYQYRKKDPEGADEKECVQNMFQCICTVIMDKDNLARWEPIQKLVILHVQPNKTINMIVSLSWFCRFLAKEGLELMLRYLKENKFAAGTVLW